MTRRARREMRLPREPRVARREVRLPREPQVARREVRLPRELRAARPGRRRGRLHHARRSCGARCGGSCGSWRSFGGRGGSGRRRHGRALGRRRGHHGRRLRHGTRQMEEGAESRDEAEREGRDEGQRQGREASPARQPEPPRQRGRGVGVQIVRRGRRHRRHRLGLPGGSKLDQTPSPAALLPSTPCRPEPSNPAARRIPVQEPEAGSAARSLPGDHAAR